jgi:hypothetical protein
MHRAMFFVLWWRRRRRQLGTMLEGDGNVAERVRGEMKLELKYSSKKFMIDARPRGGNRQTVNKFYNSTAY